MLNLKFAWISDPEANTMQTAVPPPYPQNVEKYMIFFNPSLIVIQYIINIYH